MLKLLFKNFFIKLKKIFKKCYYFKLKKKVNLYDVHDEIFLGYRNTST